MSRPFEIITIQIDNQELRVESNLSILQAAEQNDIYIPTLCAYKDLTPFGGCRMCIVEVEAMRGFPTACTTPVTPGMIVRTNTTQVQAIRTEILQLILSEHPSSCLICEESPECKKFMGTIRKAGVTTGCRYCPNDYQCELQNVVEKMAIKEVIYPIYYRNLPVEKNDPFYDRDYNLCILCGRCIRVCQEIRIANTLAFKQRGRQTVIGPAYDRTHLEAGCEFCGACVSVCPTGALYDKTRKWDGKADREEITTCALCGVGCQMRLLVKGNEIIGSLPADDNIVNKGQLCVKGRFGITELVNNHKRLKKAYKIENGIKIETTREAAIALAAAKLDSCGPDEFGMLISPNCSNEDLYVAQKFARMAMGSHNIDTSARIFYGAAFNSYIRLIKMAIPLSDVERVDTILCVGLDARYGRSVVGVAIRQAAKRGAKVITIHPRNHNLALLADKWLKPTPGTECQLVKALAELTAPNSDKSPKSENLSTDSYSELLTVAQMLKESKSSAILIGPEFINYHDGYLMFDAIAGLAGNIGAGVMPLPGFNNLFGSIMMGTYSEILPGGRDSSNQESINQINNKWGSSLSIPGSNWNAQSITEKPAGKKLKVLYLIGELPLSQRPECDFLIYQNIYPPADSLNADLVIPSAAFTETDGTFINGEGRIQRIRKAVNPPGNSLPEWEITCRIAQKMRKQGFNFTEASEIYHEIADSVTGFGDFNNPDRKPIRLTCETSLMDFNSKGKTPIDTDDKYPFKLYTSIIEHSYKGFPLADFIGGMRTIFPERLVLLNSSDAAKWGISQGDKVVIKSADFERTGIAGIDNRQTPGILYIALRLTEALGPNPHSVSIRKSDV